MSMTTDQKLTNLKITRTLVKTKVVELIERIIFQPVAPRSPLLNDTL